MAVPARIERAFREPESRVLTVGRRDFHGAPDGSRTHKPSAWQADALPIELLARCGKIGPPERT